MRRTWLLLGSLLVWPAVAGAQEVVPRGAPFRPLPIDRAYTPPAVRLDVKEPGRASLTVAGLLASTAGFVGGAVAGYQLERSRYGWSCACDDPGLEGLIYGAAIGPALTTPLSVHLANGKRGSFAASFGAAAAISALSVVGLRASDGSDTVLFFILVPPVAQGISAAIIESRTARP